MFKKTSIDSCKRKQLSLFDFFSSEPSKKNRNRLHFSASSSQDKNIGLHQIASKVPVAKASCSAASMNEHFEKDADAQSCPCKLLEALDSIESADQEIVSESAPACLEGIDEGELLKNLTEKKSIEPNNGSPLLDTWCEVDGNANVDSPLMFESEIPEDKRSSSPTPSQPLALGFPFEKLRRTPECSSTLPVLQTAFKHTVLFDETFSTSGPPNPRNFSYKDAWDANHVRLPCSRKNLYPVKERSLFNTKEVLHSRWELVESSLLGPINNSTDLEEAILTYNSRYADQWKFCALHKFFTEDVDQQYSAKFFSSTLPEMVRLALMLPSLFTEPIPLLSCQKNHTITLSQQQVACLLCNAFFCTFPWRNSRKSSSQFSNYPDINFNRLFMGYSSKDPVIPEKLKMLLHYFERVTTDMPCGAISFERRALEHFPSWDHSPCRICDLHVRSDGTIESEGRGMLQVDFANCYIGGGVLGRGAVQEEIRFCICPELIVSRLFCERLDDNECIVITGAEQFNSYSGYRDTLKWTGDFLDTTPRDEWRRRRTEIVAIDAIPFFNSKNQYAVSKIRRELHKAFCGFYCDGDPDHAPAIATGNWGCGAFGGNPILKVLIQLLAASAVGRHLCYFTFDDTALTEKIHELHSFVKANQLEIRDIWRLLVRYNNDVIVTGANEDLFEFMKRAYKESTDESDREL